MVIDNDSLFHTKKGAAVELPRPLAPLADTHGHLTSFRRVRASEALVRAALAGVRLLVVPVDPVDDVEDVPAFLSWFGQTVEDARTMLAELAAKGVEPPMFPSWENAPSLMDNVRFLAGVHPYGARTFMDDARIRERMELLLDDSRCVGVGEIGLDYGPWNKLPADVQAEAFRVQLRIAHQRNMPVELHLRDADNDEQALAHKDALRILLEEGIPSAGCDLHCFTCGPEVMQPFVEHGCHIAFGGAATFARSEAIRYAAASCPAELILSETDSPYMSPVPLRGQECEPGMVSLSVATLAEVRERVTGCTRQAVYEDLWRNANAFFGLV